MQLTDKTRMHRKEANFKIWYLTETTRKYHAFSQIQNFKSLDSWLWIKMCLSSRKPLRSLMIRASGRSRWRQVQQCTQAAWLNSLTLMTQMTHPHEHINWQRTKCIQRVESLSGCNPVRMHNMHYNQHFSSIKIQIYVQSSLIGRDKQTTNYTSENKSVLVTDFVSYVTRRYLFPNLYEPYRFTFFSRR